MSRTLILLSIGIAVFLANESQADIAQDWNNIALDLQARGNSPSNLPLFGNAVNSNPGTRASAIQWIAVNDATVPLTNASTLTMPIWALLRCRAGFKDETEHLSS
jgi:hypothetical protein